MVTHHPNDGKMKDTVGAFLSLHVNQAIKCQLRQDRCHRHSSSRTFIYTVKQKTQLLCLDLRVVLQTGTVQDQRLRERRSSLPSRDRSFRSPAPDIPHGRLSGELDQRCGAKREKEDGGVTHHANDQQDRPVRAVDGGKGDGEPAAETPEHKAVAEVDGHDVRVEDDEEFAREEPLHPRAELDHHLERD
nr:hypothetical protein CFP56_02742 [Quercus suber]